jgi:hypothetical protein
MTSHSSHDMVFSFNFPLPLTGESMSSTQEHVDATRVRYAEKNAKSAIEIISKVISQRFGDEGVNALTERQAIFQEEFDNYPSDDIRLALISEWAQHGVQQNNWETLPQDELIEMACRLSLLRAFLNEANHMMDVKSKEKAQREAEKKKKAKVKMAQASKKRNRKK